MSKYHLRISAKTRFLNLFRCIFKIKLFERLLISDKEPSSFVQKLIPPDYLYNKGAWRTATRKGINYKLDISSSVDHFIYFGFKETSYEAIQNELKNAMVILDIGAHIGSASLYYASMNPNARILAFEPHPVMFEKAKQNMALNDFKSIELYNFGFGEKKEQVKLFEVNEHNPGMNRIVAEGNFPYQLISIEVLDEFCRQNSVGKIDLVKLDVEGFEYAVLSGAKETFKNSKPVLLIEVDDANLRENGKSAKQLLELLISFGYTKFFRADTHAAIDVRTDFTNCHYDVVTK